MTTGMKMAGAAVLAAALTAAGLFSADLIFAERAVRSVGDSSWRGTSRAPSAEAAVGDTPVFDTQAAEQAFVQKAIDAERARRKDAEIRASDSGLEVLRRFAHSGADVEPLLRDFERLRAHVRPRAGPAVRIEATGEITNVSLEAQAKGAAVVEFGPGTFRLGRAGSGWGRIRKKLESLEIRGAGRDETVLLADGRGLLQIYGVARVEHLLVRDLTFDEISGFRSVHRPVSVVEPPPLRRDGQGLNPRTPPGRS